MQLQKILDFLELSTAQDVQHIHIKDIKLDSKMVSPGDLFIAIPGTFSDGVIYIDKAIENGASAIFTQNLYLTQQPKVPVFQLENLKQRLGEIASFFYKEPAKELKFVGVTGTNGKTSTTHFLTQLLTLSGINSQFMGTLGNGPIHNLEKTNLTTLDVFSMHKHLANAVSSGAQVVCAEVSSHALEQDRIAGVNVYMAIFTNLTPEHLDYHINMQSYYAAKLKLFTQYNSEYAIINLDDPYSAQLIEHIATTVSIYGITTQPAAAHIEKFGNQIQGVISLNNGLLTSPWGQAPLKYNLIGHFNNYNVLSAFTGVMLFGCDFTQTILNVTKLQAVPGRMQVINLFDTDNPQVIVDFAHTPDSLENALRTLIELNTTIWCVFGCGGDRDKAKRPQMLAVALRYADHVIITSDNPRSENAAHIAQDILQNTHNLKIQVELDRELAIKSAITQAKPADVILLAGKGHEQHQIFIDKTIKFCDSDVALNILNSRGL